MNKGKELIPQDLINNIRHILVQARGRIQQTVNASMVHAYWHIGRLIVEQEQQGAQRAEYGKNQLAQLSATLKSDYGKGFRCQQFTQYAPILPGVSKTGRSAS